MQLAQTKLRPTDRVSITLFNNMFIQLVFNVINYRSKTFPLFFKYTLVILAVDQSYTNGLFKQWNCHIPSAHSSSRNITFDRPILAMEQTISHGPSKQWNIQFPTAYPSSGTVKFRRAILAVNLSHSLGPS